MTAINQHWKIDTDWEKLPLFPDLLPCAPIFERDVQAVFDDPFLAEIAHSGPLQRLKRIGFLGAIDYVRSSNGYQSHRRRHNRYDHSVGVAELALLYADIRGLSRSESRVLAAAGLLHDIGHGPLSHTLEPVFKAAFDISHHLAGDDILFGRSPFGAEIQEIMNAYGVDLDEVAAMIEGKHDSPHSFLFSSPINLDTIEGISRSKAFATPSIRQMNPRALVAAIASSDTPPVDAIDEFWELKHEVYNLLIHNPWGLIFDGLAQAFMDYHIEDFRPADFLKTEDQLRHKVPELFYIFAWAKTSKRRAYYRVSELVPEVLAYDLRAPKRDFFINTNVQLNRLGDLSVRYTQKKEHRNLTIGELVSAERQREAA